MMSLEDPPTGTSTACLSRLHRCALGPQDCGFHTSSLQAACGAEPEAGEGPWGWGREQRLLMWPGVACVPREGSGGSVATVGPGSESAGSEHAAEYLPRPLKPHPLAAPQALSCQAPAQHPGETERGRVLHPRDAPATSLVFCTHRGTSSWSRAHMDAELQTPRGTPCLGDGPTGG